MNKIQTIFLDFDGIILESVEIKGWAFGELFKEYPRQREVIVSYHHANGGMPRFNKFRHIYKEILKEPLSDEKFQELCDRYSELVFDRVVDCDYVPGALEFLRKFFLRYALFVISGTPDEEINRVVDAKDLRRYFTGVHGSPRPKGYWTGKILQDRRLVPGATLWVGDALSDLNAAREHGIKFIGRVVGQYHIFQNQNIDYEIKDLFDLDSLLSRSIKK